MAGPGPNKRLALDANVLFDLAAGKDFAHTFREAYQGRGYTLRVPPTVIQELTHLAFNVKSPEGDLAMRALQQMRGWNLEPFDLKSVGHGITEQFSKKLMRLNLLPDDEFNDGLILAETALACVPVLVTSDADLLDIDEAKLRVCFEDADLMPVQVFHPKLLLKAIAPK